MTTISEPTTELAVESALDQSIHAADTVVRVDGVVKRFGGPRHGVVALDGLSLQVRHGELVALLGASGCGKSTLLHLLAGLDSPSAGRIEVAGRAALMFQESALFPWLTIGANVETALRLRGVARKARRTEARELLASVHLADFYDRRPHEISGGMRQRAALARALAQQAEVLLMDEPFGALDAITRDLLHTELENVWTERNFTIVFVTHDVREAVRLADRVVVLSSRPGRVLAEIAVPLARPRRTDDAAVNALAASITNELHSEVRRHAAD
jgi:NitT/TauT family transport system ATP-binding protein